MAPWMELLYLYGFPTLAAILAVTLGIILGVMPPTAKALLKKKLMLGKGGKGYLLTAYDDRLMQLEEMDVYAEGAMEKKKKHKQTLTFFLAKPLDDTANLDDNLKNEELDRDVLPPYFLDGLLPVFLAHMSKAVATNPKVLTALRIANRTNSKVFSADALLPTPVATETGELTQTVPVKVLLPYDPVDIKKNFAQYWQQSGIDAMKKRHEAIGFEKARKEYKEYIWPLVVVGVVVVIGMIVTGLATGLLG